MYRYMTGCLLKYLCRKIQDVLERPEKEFLTVPYKIYLLKNYQSLNFCF